MLTIRDAATGDLEALLGLDVIALHDPARVAQLRGAIARGECFVALRGDLALGYAVVEHAFYGNGFLALAVVRQSERRRGVGEGLVREAESRCRSAKLFTSTNASNAPMRSLLEKLGYRRSGAIENLDAGDPELVYVRFLRDGAVRPAARAATTAAEEIRALEERLLEPSARAAERELNELLADDFVEFGASGQRWNKREIVAALLGDPALDARIDEFALRPLGDGFALATYVTTRANRAPGAAAQRARRSSIWQRVAGRGWRLLFHQGTPIGANP